MNLDITPLESTIIVLGIGMLAEVVVNPKLLDALSPAGRDILLDWQKGGQLSSLEALEALADKLLARRQVAE